MADITEIPRDSHLFPQMLRDIPSSPSRIFHSGAPLQSLLERPRVAIVGNRSVTTYGKRVTRYLAGTLAEQGIVVVSGLALGVDGLAHEAALEANGLTIAVLPGPLDNILPASNRNLAHAILKNGGALVSEYAPGELPHKQNFIARNRLVSGLAQAVVVTEAGEKSGSLHTAQFGLNQNRHIFAVPGNITSQQSIGTNNLLKSFAAPVTSYIDVLYALDLYDHRTPAKQVRGRNQYEQTVLDLMLQGISDGDMLLEQSSLGVSEFSQVLTMLEIGGKIRPLGANHWAIF